MNITAYGKFHEVPWSRSTAQLLSSNPDLVDRRHSLVRVQSDRKNFSLRYFFVNTSEKKNFSSSVTAKIFFVCTSGVFLQKYSLIPSLHHWLCSHWRQMGKIHMLPGGDKWQMGKQLIVKIMVDKHVFNKITKHYNCINVNVKCKICFHNFSVCVICCLKKKVYEDCFFLYVFTNSKKSIYLIDGPPLHCGKTRWYITYSSHI